MEGALWLPMNLRTLCTSAALLTTALGCSGSASHSQDNEGEAPAVAQSNIARTAASAVPAGDLSAAVAANNAFALDLYAQALKREPTKNLLTSPISASLALTMTYAGARGTTKSEMASALHLDPNAGGSVFAGQNALSQALNGRADAAFLSAKLEASRSGQAEPVISDYQLQVVNSVWGEQTYTWEASFLDTLAANYGAGVFQEDFVHAFEPARVAINQWVSANTNDKINGLLPAMALDDETRLVLVNALHLKLPWAAAFEKSATAAGRFNRSDGSTVSARFMHRTAQLAYADDGKAQVVSLPLFNADLSLIIAVPHADIPLAEYETTLGAGAPALAAPSGTSLVDLALPKVTFTSDSVSLADALKAMGVKQAFEKDTADFSGLCKSPPDGRRLYVADVLQKTMLAMEETGVEAAAATAVIVAGVISAPIGDPIVPIPVTVDRPYLVAIIDAPTGAVLMLGHIQDPTDAGVP